jgi:hypothetical protein
MLVTTGAGSLGAAPGTVAAAGSEKSSLLGVPTVAAETTPVVAEEIRADDTWAGVRAGLLESRTAAAPATCGDAIDVPLSDAVAAVAVYQVDVTATPGA